MSAQSPTATDGVQSSDGESERGRRGLGAGGEAAAAAADSGSPARQRAASKRQLVATVRAVAPPPPKVAVTVSAPCALPPAKESGVEAAAAAAAGTDLATAAAAVERNCYCGGAAAADAATVAARCGDCGRLCHAECVSPTLATVWPLWDDTAYFFSCGVCGAGTETLRRYVISDEDAVRSRCGSRARVAYLTIHAV